MKSLFYRLIIFLDTVTEADTNYNIAWYMTHNFSKVAKMGISQLAKECYVSPATISRFCRAIGYENYAHLKQECASFLSNEKKFDNLIDMPLAMMKENSQKYAQFHSNQVCQALNHLALNLDWTVIDGLLQEIHNLDTIAFFGTRFSYSAALYLQTNLLMLDKFTMAYIESEQQLKCAKTLDNSSLAIIISITGNYPDVNFRLMQYLKKSRCKVALITSYPQLELIMPVKYKIILGDNQKNWIGKYTLLTVVELMLLRYYVLYYTNDS